MRIAVLSILLLAVASVEGAPAPFPKTVRHDRRTDAEKLQGEWVLVGTTDRKGEVISAEPGDLRLVFGTETCRFIHRSDKEDSVEETGTFTIDPNATPKRMCLTSHGEPVYCIYRFDGDTLAIRLGYSEGYPRDFTGRPKDKSADPDIWVFRRTKAR